MGKRRTSPVSNREQIETGSPIPWRRAKGVFCRWAVRQLPGIEFDPHHGFTVINRNGRALLQEIINKMEDCKCGMRDSHGARDYGPKGHELAIGNLKFEISER